MSWEVKGKDNQTKATVGSLEYNGEWMGERYVSVTVESPAPIKFAIGDYLMYRGERFEINYDPSKIKSAPQYARGDAFKYDSVKFNSLADELTRCDFLDVVIGDNQLHFTGLPKFSFYGGVQQLASRIQANLDRAYPGKWTVIVSPEYEDSKELNVSVDTQKVWDALSMLVNDFEAYFTIKDRTITIGAAGVPAAHLFKYGKGKGLYEIEQNAEADQAIVTRLRAYGSTRNLPHRYYNSLSGADGKKLVPDNMAVQYLMLPEFPFTTLDPYIDSPNKDALGIREGTIFFDGSQEGLEEIYPSIEGITAEQLKAAGVPCNATGRLDEIVSAEHMSDDGVGEVNEENSQTEAEPPTFKVTVKDLGFDINDHLTSEAATLSFKSGMLGGRDFEIVGCEAIKNASGAVTGYELELNRVYDDGIKLWFPYSAYNAKPGDSFVLLYIEMPEVYIKAAAQRLKEAAEAWLAKNDYSRSVYAPKVDEIFMARQHDEAMASGGSIASLHDTLCEGMMLLFEDDDLNIDASIFIDRLTIKEGDGPVPTYEVVLKEEKTVGRLDKMQNQIDSLSSGKGQGGGGGYSAAQIRSMIDAYGATRFLSRLKDDRAVGKIASDIGFEIGNYLAGVSGGIFAIDKETGDSFAEVMRLYVRGKAYFETLTLIEAETLAGKQYITPGGGIKCVGVTVKGLVQANVPFVLETGGEILLESGGRVLTEATQLVDNGVPDGVFRCFFLSEQDGEKTETKIVAGDQVISEMFNAKPGTSNKVTNHRYWRLVTEVNNDAYTDQNGNHYGYIDLSQTDCAPDSDEPKAGDVITQLGNRTDRKRQAAMIFSTVEEDSPSIKMLTGIGSGETAAEHYTLSGKDIISQGYDAAKGHAYFKCYGDTFIGDSDGSTYIKYDRDNKKLDIKARLSVESTIDDKTLDEYFADKLDGVTDPYKYLAAALGRTEVLGGLILTTLIQLGYTDESGLRHTLAGMNGLRIPELGGRTIASWWGGEMTDLFDKYDNRITPAPANAAAAMVRMDGSAYFSNGNVGFRTNGSGWLAGDNIKWDENGAMTFGSGIKINLGSGDATTTFGGITESLASLANFNLGLTKLLGACDANGNDIPWEEAMQSDGPGSIKGKMVKAKVPFFSVADVAAYGRGSSTGGGGGTGGGIDESVLAAYLTKDDAALLYQPKGSYAAAVHTQSFDTLTDLPDTLEGYGITDGVNDISWSGEGNALIAASISGHKLRLTKGAVLTAVTKQMVEGVLTGDITSHYHSQYLAASGTAVAAAKLATACTIWGKEFDGTANISGHMTAVGNIGTADVPAGQIYSNGSFRSMGNSGWSSETHGGGWHMTDSTWIRAWMKPVRIENFTGIGPNGFAVGLKIQSGAYNAGMELTTATTTLGLGAHENGSVYFWHSKTQPDVPDDKKYIMWFDGISWYSNFGMRVARLYLDTDRKVYVEYDAERDVIVCNRTLVSTGNVAAYSSTT